jgi:putative copper resistance protein D
VLRETSFGQVWVVRLALGVVLLTLILIRSNEHHSDRTIVLLAGLLLVSLALVGHTQTNDGALWIVHMSADGAHLLAAGAWLGGLLALGYVLMLARRLPSAEHNAQALAALIHISGMGYAAVAILIGSGLVNAWLLVGSPGRVTTTPYGQLLFVKLCLLAGMLALAAQNRFRLVPALQRSKEGYLSAESSLRVASPKRDWRADAWAGNRPDRRLARNPATRDRCNTVSLAPGLSGRLSRSSAAGSVRAICSVDFSVGYFVDNQW